MLRAGKEGGGGGERAAVTSFRFWRKDFWISDF